MTDGIENNIAEIYVALNQVVLEISRLRNRQLEMSDLLIDASNGDLSLEDVSDLQNKLIEDHERLAGLTKIIAKNSGDSCLDKQELRTGSNLTRLRTAVKS